MSDYQDRDNFEGRRAARALAAPYGAGGFKVPEGETLYSAFLARSFSGSDERIFPMETPQSVKEWIKDRMEAYLQQEFSPKTATPALIEAFVNRNTGWPSLSSHLDEQQWRVETARLFNLAVVSLRSNAARNPKIGEQINRAAQNIEIVLSVLNIEIGAE